MAHEEDYPLYEGGSDTLVVHCSDWRFQEAFRLFLREDVGLENYDSLVIPGASQLLTFGNSLPKFAGAFARPMKFLVKGHGLKRVVVIMHEDCAWYRDFVPTYVHIKGTVKEQQIQDMLTTKLMMKEEFSDIKVEMFYAAMTPAKRVVFNKVAEKR